MNHVNWYCKVYEQVQEGLVTRQGKNGQAAAMHGSLLVIGEMLSYTGDFMVPRFQVRREGGGGGGRGWGSSRARRCVLKHHAKASIPLENTRRYVPMLQ